MSTLVTPSAKSHERVTGRWVRDPEAPTPKERMIYYLKQVAGTPVPWLLWSFVCLVFLSRAGLEISAWACCALTLIYVFFDRFSRNREFQFFTVGSDLFLLGYLAVTIISAFNAATRAEAIATLGGARWVLLLYAFAYCWELFPGLNRAYALMVSAAGFASAYGIWQHFTGLDLIRGAELASAPAPNNIYFVASGFFSTPAIFGTLLAMVLPFPAAAFLLDEEGDVTRRVSMLAVCLLLVLGIFWTYHPGLWMVTGVTLLTVILMQGRNFLAFIGGLAAFLAAVVFLAYESPERMLENVQAKQVAWAEVQRAQINAQVQLWQNDMWTGAGQKALEAATYDPGNGNVYFQILAQSGILGAGFYLLFVLGFLLATYRMFQEVPPTHYWHRVLISGALASQLAFHVAGLFWFTLAESHVLYLYVLVAASISYLGEHYGRGLVPDDTAL